MKPEEESTCLERFKKNYMEHIEKTTLYKESSKTPKMSIPETPNNKIDSASPMNKRKN
jgi:hypothetical protein